MCRYFKRIAGVGTGDIHWQSKGLSDERISSIKRSDYGITPYLSYDGTKTIAEFNGSCLKQDKITYNHGKVVNIYLVYEIVGGYSSDDNYPTLQNALSGAIKLTKNADIDKYGYSGYGIGFDRRSSFSFPGGGFGQNAIVFGVDKSSPTKTDNGRKDILILEKGPTQGLEHTLTGQKMYSINFSSQQIKFCLSLH